MGAPPGSASLYGSAFQNRDTGYVVGAEGSSGDIIHRTEDGGQSWTWQAQGKIEKSLFSAPILSDDFVYAVGSQGAVATMRASPSASALRPGTLGSYSDSIPPQPLEPLPAQSASRALLAGISGKTPRSSPTGHAVGAPTDGSSPRFAPWLRPGLFRHLVEKARLGLPGTVDGGQPPRDPTPVQHQEHPEKNERQPCP